MNMVTINKITELASYAVKKPRKKRQDLVVITASIIIMGQRQEGLEWRNESLKKFGFDKELTKEEDFILKEAENIASKY